MLKILTLVGYIFTTVVSLIMAIRVEGMVYKALLMSAVIVTQFKRWPAQWQELLNSFRKIFTERIFFLYLQ